ncbi:pentatricopeptide repeat-containing protein At2g13600-like [Selaginella moellendorffii]|uniref:pentatricopeptide repeat-containing protein At2g13600-like n=1 Tax=Selaginella moellendorffii TaxID=88036 RepID=UPI000D1C7114|nr:pentatricopeptide repeat-containing protein At2g13600-like [Selaginella moellendorffii]|eukprot:XP_024531241.1 pentatricopeptide repeat-containing protein At2g13600-like [Selaginella moellendorffii]
MLYRRIAWRNHCCFPGDGDRILQEERKWLDLFRNPGVWRDNRAKKDWQNLPDFKNVETGESLWIGSLYCPRWVQSRLGENSLAQHSFAITTSFSSQEQEERRISRLLSSLRSCSASRDVVTGKELHLEAIESGLASNAYVASSLISMYSKCGSLDDAREVFEGTGTSSCLRSTACWNALLLGYATHGEEKMVLELFGSMLDQQGCVPDSRTFLAVIMALASSASKEQGLEVDDKFVKLGCLIKGMEIHSKFLRSSNCDEDDDNDIFVENSLVDFYARCGSLRDSRAVFDRMKQHSVVSWTSLILGCVENEEAELGLDLFARMVALRGFDPDARAFVAAITAATSLAAREESDKKLQWLERGRLLHSEAAKNLHDSNIYVSNAMIGMYSTCGSLVDAKAVFDSMNQQDAVSWTSMILGYTENGESERALELYSRMKCSRDARTYAAASMACASLAADEDGVEAFGKIVKVKCLERAGALMDMYAKCGSMVDARAVFDKMVSHSLISWNSLLHGYAGNGEAELALELFAALQELLELNPIPGRTLGAALVACGKLASLETGREIHARICRQGLESDKFLANSLVDFYAKSGNLAAAQEVFDSIVTSSSGGSSSVKIWSALIAGYASQGFTGRVVENLERMRESGVEPDGVTLLSVLTACSHAGEVASGRKYFQEMVARYGIKAGREHYHCMVDMLGRANELDAAVAMVKSMPLEPTVVTWTSLLAACHKWQNVEIGRFAFESLLRVDEKKATSYILMANIFTKVVC